MDPGPHEVGWADILDGWTQALTRSARQFDHLAEALGGFVKPASHFRVGRNGVIIAQPTLEESKASASRVLELPIHDSDKPIPRRHGSRGPRPESAFDRRGRKRY